MDVKKFTLRFLSLVFVTLGFSTFGQQALPELLYYRFDQPGTLVPNDAITPVGNNPASITGTSLSIGGVGLSGTALVGTGGTSSSNAINTNWNTNLSGSFTIGFWTSGFAPSSTLYYIFGDNGANGFRCFTNGAAGAGNWLMRGGGLPDITATGAATMTPNYVHFVYDDVAGTLTSYIDGVVSNTVTVPSFTGMSGTGFQVGAYNTTTGLNGLLDEFRIYNRALSLTEIQATINGTIVTGPCTSANAGVATPVDQTICVGNTATISAVGASLGTGATYQWQSSLDGTTWTNMPNDTLPAISVNPTDTTFYRMIMTCGVASDISTIAAVNTQGAALSGSYTINQFNPTSGTNFNSFQEFFDATICGGISGPVVVDVVAGTGPYIERVEAGVIAGTSTTNTITINGNGNILTYQAAGTNDRTTLNFDGTSHVIIDSLSIEATGSTHGWVMHLTNGADFNTIRNCSILASTTITGTFSAGIVASGSPTSATSYGNNTNHTTIENNFFEGGYYAVAINGSGSNNNAIGNSIRNNIMIDQRYYGVYASAQQDFEIFGNDISRPNRDNSTIYYAITARNGMANARVENNRIYNTHGNVPTNTSTIYGIDVRTNTTSMSAANPLVVANNQLYDINGGGLLYAFYMSNSNHVKFYHNTVSIDIPNAGGTGNTRLFYTTTAANDCEFKNNIMHLNRGNGGTQHMVYVNTAASAIEIDNNVYFANELGTNPNVHIGYHVNNHSTFADWQLANGGAYDQNGLEFDPNFIGGTNPDFLRPGAGAIKSLGANVQALVPVDYDSVARPTDPDPGAYEFTPLACTGVSDLTLDSLFAGGAIISWESDSPEWEVEWDSCGFEPGSGIGNLRTTTNNTGYLMDSLQMGSCICVFVREICAQGGFGPWSAPVEICVPFEYDLEMEELLSPNTRECGSDSAIISVNVTNNGTLPASNFDLRAIISGDITATVTTTFTGTIAPGATDSIVIGTFNSQTGGNIDILTLIEWVNDSLPDNDSTLTSIEVSPSGPIQIFTDPEVLCGPGPVMFYVEESASSPNLEWYDINDILLGTGDSIVVPMVDSTFTIRVMADTASGSIVTQAVGPVDNSFGPGGIFASGSLGAQSLLVEAHDEVDIIEATIFPDGSGTVQVEIRELPSQNVVHTFSHTFTQSGPGAGVVVPFNITLAPGEYQFGANPTGSTVGLYRNNDNAVYPYGDPNLFEVTGNTFNPTYYYYYYNIIIEVGSCPREDGELTLDITDAPVAGFNFVNSASLTGDFVFTGTADTVIWDFAGLGTAMGDSANFVFPQADSFEVCVIAINGCGADTLCQWVNVLNISIDEFALANNLQVYPNPGNGQFTLSFIQENSSEITIQLLDLSGKTLWTEHREAFSGKFSKTFDQGLLPAGTYLLRVHTDEDTTTRRVVISK